MSAIAAYRTAILALLSDASKVIFTDNDVDQALRWALSEYSHYRPLIRTYQYTVIGTTAVHTLPADFITRHIIQVDLYNSDPDLAQQLVFYAYRPDEQWVINTKLFRNDGDVLTVYYSDPHQVDGLDSAAGTTVPDADETIVQVGAAGRAASIRAFNRIENIGMNADETKTYRLMAADYIAQFVSELIITIEPVWSEPDFPPDTKLVF